jgi:hypothetical protein
MGKMFRESIIGVLFSAIIAMLMCGILNLVLKTPLNYLVPLSIGIGVPFSLWFFNMIMRLRDDEKELIKKSIDMKADRSDIVEINKRFNDHKEDDKIKSDQIFESIAQIQSQVNDIHHYFINKKK